MNCISHTVSEIMQSHVTTEGLCVIQTVLWCYTLMDETYLEFLTVFRVVRLSSKEASRSSTPPKRWVSLPLIPV